MDYEKKYKEAFERVKKLLSRCKNNRDRRTKVYRVEDIESIFPELAESEDEKIKEDLIEWISDFPDMIWSGHYKKDVIAWLEKQESCYSFEIKKGHWYKCVCDYMLNNSDLMFKNDRLYYCRSDWRLRGEIDERNVKNIGVNGYKSFFRPATNQEIKEWLEKQGEQKPIFRAGDTIRKVSTGYVVTISEVDIKNKEYRLTNTGFIPFKYESLWQLVEQKPADKVEPKFKIGDWITDGCLHGKISEVLDDRYIVDTKFEKRSAITFKSEYNYRLWSIQDAKDGDILAGSKDEVILIFRGIGNKEWNDVIDYYCCYECYRKEFIVQKDLNFWGHVDDTELKPATKKQRDLLFSKIKESGWEWDSNKKELKKIDTYCQENCKGFQETGRCFCDGECKAKKEYIKQKGKQKQDVSIQISPSKYVNDMGGNGCYLKNATQTSTWSKKDEKVDNQNCVKSADDIKPKFKVGDWISNDMCDIHIASIENGMYYFDEGDGLSIVFVDEHYHLWTIEDAKDGDVLAFKNNIGGIIIVKSSTSYDTKSYCRLISDNFINKEESGWDSTLLVPATKEQRDFLFQKMKEAGYIFDFEKKELKKIENDLTEFENALADVCRGWIGEELGWKDYIIKNSLPLLEFAKKQFDEYEQKSAWSEKDETYLDLINTAIKLYYTDDKGKENPWREELLRWFKSLKDRVQPQSNWKPSEEQVKAFEHFVRSIGESGYASPYENNTKFLYSLLNDLKKLTE